MTTIHTATLPDGTIAYRTSRNRVYSHVIAIGPRARADVVRYLEDDLVREELSVAGHRRIIEYVKAGGELVLGEKRSFLRSVHAPGLTGIDPYRGIGWVGNDGTFLLTEGETLAVQVITWYSQFADEERLTSRRAKITDTAAGPEWIGGWEAMTWASRPDLAEKAAARHRGHGREVAIIETERRTK